MERGRYCTEGNIDPGDALRIRKRLDVMAIDRERKEKILGVKQKDKREETKCKD